MSGGEKTNIQEGVVNVEEQVIDTWTAKKIAPPSEEKKASEPKRDDGGSALRIQKQLDVNGSFAQVLFNLVKKGDIEAVKKQEERLGVDISYLIEDSLKQNALFQVNLISNE